MFYLEIVIFWFEIAPDWRMIKTILATLEEMPIEIGSIDK